MRLPSYVQVAIMQAKTSGDTPMLMAGVLPLPISLLFIRSVRENPATRRPSAFITASATKTRLQSPTHSRAINPPTKTELHPRSTSSVYYTPPNTREIRNTRAATASGETHRLRTATQQHPKQLSACASTCELYPTGTTHWRVPRRTQHCEHTA